MTVAPTPVGQGAISAETRQPWAGDAIYTLPRFLRLLATIDVGDAASVGTHHHLANGTMIASEVSTMATRGGITDLCVCNRAELFLTFDTLPSSFWAYGKDNHSMLTTHLGCTAVIFERCIGPSPCMNSGIRGGI
jgi:hypothetical protein